MKKTIANAIAFVIVISMLITAIPVYAYSNITSPDNASGYDYTNNSKLAKKLDEIINGNIDLYVYSSGSYARLPIGSYMSNSTMYSVKSNTTGALCLGYQCYAYANAVYNKLFNEWAGHGESFAHSYIALQGGNALSYERLKNAYIRTGAYVRTTTNPDGSFNSSSGHSFIILSYDKDKITMIEGNADGNGLVRISERTWAEFNNNLANSKRYICHIIQPTESYFNSLYSNAGTGQAVRGDVNHDGKVDSLDATKILRYMAEFKDSDFDVSLADMNRDGKVNTSDATAVLRFVAGL